MTSERELDQVGVLALADALEEAGCTNGEVLEHCRGEGTHHRGCWVIEELSGRSARGLPGAEGPAKNRRPAPLIPMKRQDVKPPARA